jgi:glycosyltransferase involved in cell wall biosynthesis
VEKKNALLKHPSLKHLYQLIVQSRTEFDVLNEADHIIVDTEYVANQIKHLHAKKKIAHLPWMYVVPQGIQSHFLTLQPINTKQQYILSVGSQSRRKGQLLLIKAFEKVHREIPDVHLVIAGTLTENEYFSQMQREIEKLHLSQFVQIHSNIAHEDLLTHYQKASLFALHSQEESQGIALVEAMAAGLPVVSTTVGGIPFVVKDGETGMLSKYGNVDNFADNMIKLLMNEDLRKQMSQAARVAAQSYLWQNIANFK